MSWVLFTVAVLALGDADGGADAGLAPPQRVEARATSAQVVLGEHFNVEVAVTHQPDQRYELGPLAAELEDFDFVTQLRSRSDLGQTSVTTFLVTFAAFRLGTQRTPALTLEVASPAGVAQVPVEGVEVEVVGTLPASASTDGAQLFDVHPPQEVPVPSYRLLYALAGLLAAGLLAFLVRRWWLRRKAFVPPPPPPEPAHVRALRLLDALQREDLPGKGRAQEYYFRLSEVVRGYLGEVYRFEALESTTPELLAALQRRSTPGLPLTELSDFAYQSDFVRYAKALPDAAECQRALTLAYRIVHGTAAATAATVTRVN